MMILLAVGAIAATGIVGTIVTTGVIVTGVKVKGHNREEVAV
jgi:hypothetical protein